MPRVTFSTVVVLIALVACSAPPLSENSNPLPPPGPPAPSQTLYAITFAGGLQSDLLHPFSAMGVTGDPVSTRVSADPVYLVLPSVSGGDPSVCDQGGSGLAPSTGSWDGYAGVWKGSFSVTPPGNWYVVNFNATREDGTGWLWLVMNGTGVKTNNNLTLTVTNQRGLVSLYSTPTGSFDPRVGPFDPQDRCLTFSITATP
jgi:hypothetical protein